MIRKIKPNAVFLSGDLAQAIQLLDRLGLTPTQQQLSHITPKEVSCWLGPVLVGWAQKE
jgi:hypothetical protein